MEKLLVPKNPTPGETLEEKTLALTVPLTYNKLDADVQVNAFEPLNVPLLFNWRLVWAPPGGVAVPPGAKLALKAYDPLIEKLALKA
jgi:hypothetical protein